ncbi:hypothetical protein [Bacillus sp. HMF5848]|uniref:hypothetical protein n=1 Tax=Bacillus sp. HMF5848 TaxID=2495421 RepID=UPI00163A4D46|nr:hypothetical protein [Bacillus sp. HMF5848]
MPAKKTSTTTKATADKKEEVNNEVMEMPRLMNQFVDTFWNQYERSVARARQMREQREDAYLNALKELMQFNKEYRASVVNLYSDVRKTNTELMKQAVATMNARTEDAEQPKSEEENEMLRQWQDVAHRAETLATTPIKSGFEMMDRLAGNLENNVESYVAYSREQRKQWEDLGDEYMKYARNTHHKVVDRLEDTMKTLVNAR